MADYYPLIARAIAGLDPSAPGESRRALYERARGALIAQLRSIEPPLHESEITRERLSLEDAVRKVESEAAQRARATSHGSTPNRSPDNNPPPAPIVRAFRDIAADADDLSRAAQAANRAARKTYANVPSAEFDRSKPPTAPTLSAADQNLAEMARRLEAALRRPGEAADLNHPPDWQEEALRQRTLKEEAARRRALEEEAARQRALEEEATRRRMLEEEAARQLSRINKKSPTEEGDEERIRRPYGPPLSAIPEQNLNRAIGFSPTRTGPLDLVRDPPTDPYDQEQSLLYTRIRRQLSKLKEDIPSQERSQVNDAIDDFLQQPSEWSIVENKKILWLCGNSLRVCPERSYGIA
jgi:hypothetical protein